MRIAALLNSETSPTLQWAEVASSLQIPSFQIVGLPAPEVAEARERIRAAISASGFEFPKRRIVVNLSPASIRKQGTALDLAIALAILAASHKGELSYSAVMASGELGLDGTIKPTGNLTRGLYAACAAGIPFFSVGQEEYFGAQERLAWIEASKEFTGSKPRIVPASTLREAWESVLSSENKKVAPPSATQFSTPAQKKPSSLMRLPRNLERIVGISASGAHHVLLLGPRGSGKSHALDWLIEILPPLSEKMRLDNVVLSELCDPFYSPSSKSPPIRRISSIVRPSALVGGAQSHAIRPGEFTLAHGGVLIADELPEWARDSREILREPLERRKVTLTRTHRSLEMPAGFMLAANGNLCPCGGWPPDIPPPAGGIPAPCSCSSTRRRTYLKQLSGPILDRIDLVAMVANPDFPGFKEEAQKKELDAVEKLALKVSSARIRLEKRWGTPPGALSSSEVENILCDNLSWIRFLESCETLSLRSRHKIVRVAMTLAEWDQAPTMSLGHFLEAAHYRSESYGL